MLGNSVNIRKNISNCSVGIGINWKLNRSSSVTVAISDPVQTRCFKESKYVIERASIRFAVLPTFLGQYIYLTDFYVPESIKFGNMPSGMHANCNIDSASILLLVKGSSDDWCRVTDCWFHQTSGGTPLQKNNYQVSCWCTRTAAKRGKDLPDYLYCS